MARCSHWDAAQQYELKSRMAGTDLLPADLWLYFSRCPSVPKTHTLMPQKLIWATQVAGFRRSLLHHTGCSFWQRRWTENLMLPVQLGHWWCCACTNPNYGSQLFCGCLYPFGSTPLTLAYSIPLALLWGVNTELVGSVWPSCPTSLPTYSTISTLPARRGRHEYTCRGVAEAETITSRLWLTATFPFGHSSFPFRFPLWRDSKLGAEERGDDLGTYRAPHAESGRPHVCPVHHRNVSYEAWEAQPYTWPEDHT